MMIFSSAVLCLLSVAALMYLPLLKTPLLGPVFRKRIEKVSTYLILLLTGAYGCIGLADLLGTPLLIPASVYHYQYAERIFEQLLDRPFFPLQSIVAFFAGYLIVRRVGKKIAIWVWAPPFLWAVLVVGFSTSASLVESYWQSVWRTYFNWSCDCSVTLRQWEVMAPVYSATSFSPGALVSRYHCRGRLHPNTPGGNTNTPLASV
jgi:hypothetical protein